MKIYKAIILTSLIMGFLNSCSIDKDDLIINNPEALIVEKFIYRGLNDLYLYKSEVPELGDNYFRNLTERNNFLQSYDTPKKLFYEGLTAPYDKFSEIVEDYVVLENSFVGINKTTGMNFNLNYLRSGSEDLFGYVRYVLPGTSAEEQGVKRGNIFIKANGMQLTLNNYQDLLTAPTVVLSLANLDGNILTETGETISLKNTEHNSNPVFIKKIFNINNSKVGYLMYNGFIRNYDSQLNEVFGEFKTAGITDLILDLRYNGGGDVRTATDLASMITGQFPGKIFMKEEWNDEYQAYFESTEESREYLLNRFNTKIRSGETINSLKLSRVFVLTTQVSASASELIINGLNPYINVIQVGDKTRGKFAGSITLYDSPNFGRINANISHKYALQPLVFKSVNVDGISDYINGLEPDLLILENIRSLGDLGDVNEPLLRAALDIIEGNRRSIYYNREDFKHIGESTMFNVNYQQMYTDKLPPQNYQTKN